MVDLSIARKGIELLYNCTCTIERLFDVVDEYNITKQEWQVVAENIACKRAIKTIESATIENNVATVGQVIKLFIAPEIRVLAGDKIAVTDVHKFVEYYKSTGKPAIFYNHQEVILETVDRWA